MPGQNLPACHPRHVLTSMEAQIIGNLFANLALMPEDIRMQMHSCFKKRDDCAKGTGKGGVRRSSIETLVADLLAVDRNKIRKYKRRYDKDHAAFGAGMQTTAADVDDLSNSHLEDPSSLRESMLPSVDALDEEESDVDLDMPAVREGLIDTWKQHERYAIGMRLAELSVMWHVNGWAKQKFPCFLAWATKHFPYAFGNINHSKRFMDSFLPSVVQATHSCLASTLHACVPALGLPSLLTRIIDVVSIHGRRLLPTIHVFTDSGHF